MLLFNFIKYNNARGKDRNNNNQLLFCFVFWIFGCVPMAVLLKDLLDGNIIALKRFGPYRSC